MVEEILGYGKEKLKEIICGTITNFIDAKKRDNFLKDLEIFLINECSRVKSETSCKILEKDLYSAVVNCNVIERLFNFYIIFDTDSVSFTHLLDYIEEQIVKCLDKSDDVQCQKSIKDFIKRLNALIYTWVVDNADVNVKGHLENLRSTESVFQEIHEFGNKIMNELKKIKNEERLFANLSFNDLSKMIKSRLLNYTFDCNLFGYIELNGENYSSLAEINSIPSQIFFLVGDGGVGKTTHLQKFQKDMLKNNNILPIYISLCDKINDDPIEKRIAKIYPTINGENFSVEKLNEIFSSCHNGEHIIILLDGLNEYKGNKEDLFDNINDLCNYPNISFIVTSRYSVYAHNITADKLGSVTEANIGHLCEDQVCEYLGIKTFPVHLDEKATDLLTTPF